MSSQFPQPVAQNQTIMIQNSSKKTMGRRKIEIKPIFDKKNLQVTFSKRRSGVFRKASELSILCGADIAIVVCSPANKFYTFGSPNVDSVLHQFETGSSSSQVTESKASLASKTKYMDAVKRLENEKKRSGMESHVPYGMNWWDYGIESMELNELEEYLAALEGLKSKVLKKVDEFEKNNKVTLESASSSFINMESEGRKYDDWQAILSDNQLINEGEASTSMFGDLKVEDDIGTVDINAACFSSLNLVTLPTGFECYVDDSGGLEDIFKNMS